MSTVSDMKVQDHPELGPDPIATRVAGAFQSARLRYRGVETDDAAFVFRLRSIAEVQLNTAGGWPRPMTLQGAQELVKMLQGNVLSAIVELDPSKDHPGLAEELRHPSPPSAAEGSKKGDGADAKHSKASVAAAGVPIGLISLRSTFGASNAPVRTAELAIDLFPAYQGKGYASEAMRWILDWGFDMAGLHRIRLGCFSFNTKAIRAYDAVGFKRCGVEEEALWMAGRWWDFVSYGLLDREWASIKEDRKKKGLRV